MTAPLIKEIKQLEQQQTDLSARTDELSELLNRPDTYEDQERVKKNQFGIRIPENRNRTGHRRLGRGIFKA